MYEGHPDCSGASRVVSFMKSGNSAYACLSSRSAHRTCSYSFSRPSPLRPGWPVLHMRSCCFHTITATSEGMSANTGRGLQCQAIPLSQLWSLQKVEREGCVELRRMNEIGILKGDLKPILADQEPPHALLQLSCVCNLSHLRWHLTV